MTTQWKKSKWSSFWHCLKYIFAYKKWRDLQPCVQFPLLDKIKCWILGKGKVMTTHQVFPNIPLNKRASCTRHEHELRWYEYNVTFCGSWSVLVCCTPQLFSQQFSTFKSQMFTSDAFGQGYCTWLKSSPKCLICFHILILQVLLSILFNQD